MARNILILTFVLGLAQSSAAQVQAQTQAAPPPAPAATATPAAVNDERGYQIGPGDRLDIKLFGEPTLPSEFTIGIDGAITFPYLNNVKVAGLTLRALEEHLRQQLIAGKFFEQPTVTVQVLEYRSQKVQISGAVGNAGELQLSGNDMTLSAALAKAGLSANAGSQIEIRRPKPGAAPGAPDYDTQVVQMKDLIALTNNPRLQDGDYIFIPQAPQYQVTGQTRQTGNFVWKPGITVSMAIAQAGGLSERGTYRGLKIRRLINGEYKDVDAELETKLLPDDQLIVKQKVF